ncbi:protein of unknown function [Hyphomicrobium sp. 1Nfss2.1]
MIANDDDGALGAEGALPPGCRSDARNVGLLTNATIGWSDAICVQAIDA